MSNNIIFTTSNSIENRVISEYLDVISAQIVIGTNIFSDIKASLTDFFGGHSESYQHKLQGMFDEAKQILLFKAQRLKADAIIGLHFDTSPISGKEMSMLMTVVSGTAVKFIKEKKQEEAVSNVVSATFLSLEVKRFMLEDRIKNLNLPNYEDWELILEIADPAFLKPLLEIYTSKVFSASDMASNLFKENFPEYLNRIKSKDINNTIYYNIEHATNWQPLVKLVKECKLFSPFHLIQFVNMGYQNVIVELITADKEEYSIEDLKLMEELKAVIQEKIEPKFKRETSKLKALQDFYIKVDILDKLLCRE